MYSPEIMPAGLRHLGRLPDNVRDAALATIFGPVAKNPHRAGKPLGDELSGLRSARRGDYRIAYEILEDEMVVLIHRIQHRRHVYRPR